MELIQFDHMKVYEDKLANYDPNNAFKSWKDFDVIFYG